MVKYPKGFDPLAYIESAFVEHSVEPGVPIQEEAPAKPAGEKKVRFRKTELSAPRPRKIRESKTKDSTIKSEMKELWRALPENIDFLSSFFDDSVTANYYRGDFKETREDLIRRLLDPELTLEEVSRLLGVCPATVRRYTNRKWLHHHRTKGGQRRFRLSGVVKFVQEHGRHPEE